MVRTVRPQIMGDVFATRNTLAEACRRLDFGVGWIVSPMALGINCPIQTRRFAGSSRTAKSAGCLVTRIALTSKTDHHR